MDKRITGVRGNIGTGRRNPEENDSPLATLVGLVESPKQVALCKSRVGRLIFTTIALLLPIPVSTLASMAGAMVAIIVAKSTKQKFSFDELSFIIAPGFLIGAVGFAVLLFVIRTVEHLSRWQFLIITAIVLAVCSAISCIFMLYQIGVNFAV